MNAVVSEKRERISSSLEKPTLVKVPRHVAIIMDGNRRWAKKRHQPVHFGHYRGVEALDRTVEAAADLGIEVLTVYAFSTENWNRSCEEVNGLMHLFKTYLRRKKKSMLAQGVRLKVIGDISKFPLPIQKELKELVDLTKSCDAIELVLALNYGSRNEITRAVKKIVDDVEAGNLGKTEVTESLISKYLDTAGICDPELLIRTSGERRLSNFLLWQLSYTEVISTDTLWPDFCRENLVEILIDYQQRERRFGE